MAAPQISTLPPFPVRGEDPATFATKANAHVVALSTFVTEANTQADYTDTKATEADASATAAAAQVVLATAQAVIATDASNVAKTSANFVGNWSDQTGAAAIPTSVLYNGSYWQLIANVADITASVPGVSADWANIIDSVTQARLDEIETLALAGL